jgi:hypothetical protein
MTFAHMNKRKNTFLKIFLLVVLFFFQGINTHPNLATQRYYIELSHDTDDNKSRFNPDNDSSDETQIDQAPISGLSEQPECQKFCFRTLFFLNTLFVSVWQPPEVI